MEPLYQDARQIIEDARKNAVRSVDFNRVLMYWNLGQRIFEEEQQGKKRADYGTYLTKELSRRLVPDSWNSVVNSIAPIQLRTHCVRN